MPGRRASTEETENMSIEALRDIVAGLTRSASALGALAAAVDARASGLPLDPRLRPHVDEVVAALGVGGALDAAGPAQLRPLLGEMRTYALAADKLMFAASRGAGWSHGEAELLVAAGDVSAGFPQRLENAIAPQLAGLGERLRRPGAAFLDVGVGVAALAIEMARGWPGLHVVGIDPHEPALSIARRRVCESGLEARVELRCQAAEQLDDVDAFDLAWIPGLFVPQSAVPAAVERVGRALRKGGWLLFPLMRAGGDRMTAALARLRTAMFGGAVMPPESMVQLLRSRGYSDVVVLAGPASAPTAMVAGRRPP
jgi:SAM-dependent methyltransferase